MINILSFLCLYELFAAHVGNKTHDCPKQFTMFDILFGDEAW